MKKLLLFIVLISLIQIGKAQHWLQPGATYNYQEQNQSTIRYEQMNYIKDTLVQGRVCSYARNHIQTCYSFPCSPIYTIDYFFNRQNDSVFMASNGNWRFLFNLNPQLNDIWDYGPPASGTSPCTANNRTMVDSIKFDTINGFSIKKIFVHAMTGSTYGYSGYITDRYGPANSFFDYKGLSVFCPPTNISPWYYTLSCYSDSAFHTGISVCPSPFYFSASLSIFSNVTGYRIYPNPANATLTIQLNKSTPFTVYIYNSIGQLVLQKNNSTTMDISELNKGIYNVAIVENGKIILKNFIKL